VSPNLLPALLLAGVLATDTRRDDPIPIGFGLLASFDYQTGKALPDEIRRLDGRLVSVTGFMRSDDERTENIEWFVIINEACGCEGEPKLNEVLYCAMPEGQRTNVLPGSVKVTGILLVGEDKMDDGFVLSLYRMEVIRVEKS
jgi:hypothetical protein